MAWTSKLSGEFILTAVEKLTTKGNTLKTVFISVYHVTKTGITFDVCSEKENQERKLVAFP